MQAAAGAPLTPTGAPDTGPPRRWQRTWLVVAAGVYASDQVTKAWAQAALSPGQPRQLLGDVVRLDLVRNSGAAFSIGTGYTVLLSAVAVVVVIACVRLSSRLRSTTWGVALGLLLGGALGNLTDRLLRAPGPLRGEVVDFVRLPHWPVFNLADASICAAAVLVIWLTARSVRLDGAAPTAPSQPADDRSRPSP